MTRLQKLLNWLKGLFIHPKEEKSPMSKIVLVLAVGGGVVADGINANTLTVTVTDDAGAPLVGQPVTLSGDVSVAFSATNLTTDASGSATSGLTSTQAGTYQVTATLADGTTQSISVVFLAASVITNQVIINEPLTPAAEVKAGVQDFEAALRFVEDGVEKLGDAAKDELVALAKKYL